MTESLTSALVHPVCFVETENKFVHKIFRRASSIHASSKKLVLLIPLWCFLALLKNSSGLFTTITGRNKPSE